MSTDGILDKLINLSVRPYLGWMMKRPQFKRLRNLRDKHYSLESCPVWTNGAAVALWTAPSSAHRPAHLAFIDFYGEHVQIINCSFPQGTDSIRRHVCLSQFWFPPVKLWPKLPICSGGGWTYFAFIRLVIHLYDSLFIHAFFGGIFHVLWLPIQAHTHKAGQYDSQTPTGSGCVWHHSRTYWFLLHLK